MPSTAVAQDFGSPSINIGNFLDGVIEAFIESRPPTTRIELGGRLVEGCPATHTRKSSAHHVIGEESRLRAGGSGFWDWEIGRRRERAMSWGFDILEIGSGRGLRGT